MVQRSSNRLLFLYSSRQKGRFCSNSAGQSTVIVLSERGILPLGVL